MSHCRTCCQEEIKLENVLLTHEDPAVFVTSQWPIGRCPFVTYRVSAAALFLIWVIVDLAEESIQYYSEKPALWLIFATNWSFLLVAASNIYTAATATYYYIRARKYEDNPLPAHGQSGSESQLIPNEVPVFEKMPLALSIQWFLYNVAANSALVVTLSYWTFLVTVDDSAFLSSPMDRLKHSLNTVYVICDLLLTATPVKIFHLVYPMIFGAVYSVFNAVYFIQGLTGPDGRHYAYSVLDWRNPLEASITCALAFLLSTLNQLLLYEIYVLRMWLYSKFKPQGEAKPNPVQDREERLNILQLQENSNISSSPDYHTVQPEVIEMEGRPETKRIT